MDVRLLDFLVHGKVEIEVFWVPYKYHVIVYSIYFSLSKVGHQYDMFVYSDLSMT